MKNKTKNNKINSSIILLSLLFLNGCLSSNSFKYNSRESLVIGKTTQAELFQIVGKHNETQTQKIGSKSSIFVPNIGSRRKVPFLLNLRQSYVYF